MTGTWVGPGSAARNTGRTSRRESIKIGTFPAGQYNIIATPLLLRFGLVYIYIYIYIRPPNLLESKFDYPGRQQNAIVTLILVLLKHYIHAEPETLLNLNPSPQILNPKP